jgi:hypothetical protein
MVYLIVFTPFTIWLQQVTNSRPIKDNKKKLPSGKDIVTTVTQDFMAKEYKE